jgi:flagellar biosynthesis protein FlhG
MMKRTRTISISSGKGGVGKTTLVCNLAVELAKQNRRVLILDGDLGMANVDILFGQRAPFSIEHVLKERCTLEEIIHPLAPNISLIPGGSGVYGLTRLANGEKQRLLDQVSALENVYDDLIIDTAPGIDETVLYLSSAAQEILVVVSPDPASLTDAYALIKVLNQRYRETRFSIVCNLVRDEQEARSIFTKLCDVAARFLCVSLDFRGFIPMDLNLRQATKRGQLIVNAFPSSPAAHAISRLACNLSEYQRVTELKGGMQFFWQHLSGVA